MEPRNRTPIEINELGDRLMAVQFKTRRAHQIVESDLLYVAGHPHRPAPAHSLSVFGNLGQRVRLGIVLHLQGDGLGHLLTSEIQWAVTITATNEAKQSSLSRTGTSYPGK